MADLNVVNPKHYQQEGQESIDNIRDRVGYKGFKGFLLGNVHKYLYRFEYKHKDLGDLERREAMRNDLKKAQWYLCRYIGLLDYEINEVNRLQENQGDDPLKPLREKSDGDAPSDVEI